MPGFCVSCGAPMTGVFCNKCGARAVPPSAPVQAAPPPAPVSSAPVPSVLVPPAPVQSQAAPPPAAPAAKSSGIGKVLLWVGGILLVLFIAGAAAAIYGVYWVKHKVATYTSAVTGDSGDSIKVVASGNSCRLLSTAELQQVLGVTIEKSAEIVEDSAPGCAYYTNQEAFNQLQKMAMDQARRQTEEANKRPGPKPDNLPALMKNANDLEGVVKTFAMSQPSKDGRVFSFTVQGDYGEDKWAGARLTESAVPGYEEVPGIGDHAMMGAFGHLFMVLKGSTVISMNMTMVPDARARGVQLGQEILGHL